MANSELQKLNGVGAATISQLNSLGLFTIQDLCFHLPNTYQNKTKVTPISNLDVGEEALIEGEVVSVQAIYRPRKMLVAKISDGYSYLNLRLFYFHPNQTRQFQKGLSIRCYGKTSLSKYGLEMIHPDYEINQKLPPLQKTLNPTYRICKGISQNKIKKFIQEAIKVYDFEDEAINLKHYGDDNALSIKDALEIIHNPSADIPIDDLIPGGTHPARVKLLKEELIAFQTGMVSLRSKMKTTKAEPCIESGSWCKDFLSMFPYELTTAQSRVESEINKDLIKSEPMMRLVQGDVGSGKTAVAVLAATKALDSNFQAAFMAPTTLLAQQHFENIKKFFPNHIDEIELLTSGLTKSFRKKILEKIKAGKIKFIVGTHAIFQADVEYCNLALAIIDEQHRFGVNQRLALIKKTENQNIHPHQLTLTATPIPRTLSMSIYANMDVSVIDEMPPGRQPIITSMLSMQSKENLISRTREAITKDSLIYWICPLVEESETLDLSSVTQTHETLCDEFGEDKVGLVHGKLSKDSKNEEIDKFRDGKIKILVSTTVIEVGVDVPDADIMIIENAERFGLAQLHQLRGRVGRGSKQSYCILLHKDKLNEVSSERLDVLCQTQDGFKIAEKDLEIRGPGEIMGAQQTGIVPFKYANLIRDSRYLEETKLIAEKIFNEDRQLANKLIKRWVSGSMAYADT
ncbi:MAG: ATP-dependent DNA helicase RecG [Gammaproteobacteria bacterium]